MVSEKERRDIKKLMARISAAKKDGASEETIKKRAAELHQYLVSRGLLNQFDE